MRAVQVAACCGALAVLTACTGGDGSSPTRPVSPPATPRPSATVDVLAVLHSTHPNGTGHLQTFRAPLVGHSIRLTGAGTRRSVVVDADADGHAVARVPPGTYRITISLADACPPVSVTLAPGEFRAVDLGCVAP